MSFEPKIDQSVFIADGAKIIGNVIIGKNSSVWYNSVIRCDFENTEIRIGENTNIQDGSVIHVDDEGSTYIGNNVTIGHNCIIHACTIENNCIIGMGAIILSGATIKSNSIVGAGSLVKENSIVSEGMLAVGIPSKTVKEVSSEQKNYISILAEEYVEFSKKHKNEVFSIVKS